MHTLNLIVEYSGEGRVLRNGPTTPWDTTPEHWERFKNLTAEGVIITDTKTLPLIPDEVRLSSGKKWMVITPSELPEKFEEEVARGRIETYPQLQHALDQTGVAFIIGGQKLYETALPYADSIYATVVRYDGEGDKFFPLLSAKWHEVDFDERKEFVSGNGTIAIFTAFHKRNH